ncbi:High-affinity methionine permease [Colletotrichum higginsianum IMI 349063]|uniref:High-affinity methionine permease n=1 Tax=Colletotrichum higginsianum (strain IMI 349063) TaxID=759273 RepID=A0A1B7XWT7_COLHI|nr:High-affinity methionine permease [Colletotrichum higginsianum IMI 349063]OBR04204.1 High-affinity methionine permease [Colletotrichum higginsianum IMI 349063]
MVFSKLSSPFKSSGAGVHAVDVEASDSEHSIIRDGDLAYTLAKGGNGSRPAYQEAVGAPVEKHSPLGYHVGWLTVIFLNVNQMIGTAASVLNGTGSVGLAFIYWTLGFLMALAGLSVYLELASYFPNRSGSEVVYLEQAYPRPKHFFPIAFAVQSVLLSFSSSNAIVLSRYLWRIAGKTPSPWELKGVAIAAYTFAVICVIAHNKYSLWATNIIGAIKIVTLVFISITGLVVLGGNLDHIPDPTANFRNSFEGTTDNGNDLATALVNVIFSYTGYSNAFNVVNEIKNPIPVLKRHATISVVVVSVLYMFCNVAYFAAVPKAEFRGAKEIAAAVFFTKVFGKGPAEQALNFLVLLSAFGNLLAVLIGSSRVIREIGRQGVLPWTEFWVNTKPFGTPIGPYLLKWVMTFIMIAAPPAGDAFQFVVSLKTYPDGIFHFAMAIGVYIIRTRRKRANLGRTEFKSWHVTVIFFILLQVYILAMPWWPPKGGPYAGNVSFWYATYCVVGIAVLKTESLTRILSLIVCFLYYAVWMWVLPKWRGYRIRPEILDVSDNGANTHRLVRVPLPELAQWDAEHDDAGNLRRRHVVDSERSSKGDVDVGILGDRGTTVKY